jgi:hypothetical protein
MSTSTIILKLLGRNLRPTREKLNESRAVRDDMMLRLFFEAMI